MLPSLMHWGKSERGMMKDQPQFRLQKIRKMLGSERTNGSSDQNTRCGKKNNTQLPSTSQVPASKRQISLVQSLSLRRHHLKLLNPKFSMSSLRLGDERDIRDAAALFEECVEAYLRRRGVAFWTEEEQKEQFERRTRGMPRHRRKQPPTPDFMLKEGHCAALSLATDDDAAYDAADGARPGAPHPTSLHWIEAKMFYGASTIPSGTPNAVGCILPKVAEYVRLYGTGGIVFMYGCGARLAAQLLEAGVVALDGRGLDLERVEQHQRWWCGDSRGNILF